jgi:hypothetical protein
LAAAESRAVRPDAKVLDILRKYKFATVDG